MADLEIAPLEELKTLKKVFDASFSLRESMPVVYDILVASIMDYDFSMPDRHGNPMGPVFSEEVKKGALDRALETLELERTFGQDADEIKES